MTSAYIWHSRLVSSSVAMSPMSSVKAGRFVALGEWPAGMRLVGVVNKFVSTDDKAYVQGARSARDPLRAIRERLGASRVLARPLIRAAGPPFPTAILGLMAHALSIGDRGAIPRPT